MGKIIVKAPTEEELKDARDNYIRCQRNNRNNFSYWFGKTQPVTNFGIAVPKSIVVPVDPDTLDAFFLERDGDGGKIREWANKTLFPVIGEIKPPLFVKNGCFSNKFDFAGSCLVDSVDAENIIRHIEKIQYTSLCYDTMGNMEFVVREWIEPEKGYECIYNGMPLRPEMRVFYDFTNHKYLYDVNYWDWDYCHDAICRNEADKVVYERQYPLITEKLESRRDRFIGDIKKALASIDQIDGIWSVDFILDEEKPWLIDMAIAQMSAYWNLDKA